MSNGEVQQINPEPSQPMAAPPAGGGSGWIAWVVGIVLVILVGGGVYYYYQYIKMPELENEKTDLESQVNTLQQQLESEESGTNESTEATEGTEPENAPEGNTQPVE